MNTSTNTWRWVQIGAGQWTKWGIFLTLTYTAWLTFKLLDDPFLLASTDLIEQLSSGAALSFQTNTPVRSFLSLFLPSPFIFLFMVVAGGIPALIIGVVSGMLQGGLLSHHAIRSSPKRRLLVSAVLGIAGALTINVVGAWLLLNFWSYALYPTPIHWGGIGLPSILYLGVCLIFSQRIPLLVERDRIIQELPVTPFPQSP